MKKLIRSLLLLSLSLNLFAAGSPYHDECAHIFKPFKHSCYRLHQIWYQGKKELEIPSYTWHNRFYYTNNKTYNENPWGGGLGRNFYDEDGDLHVLYTFAFLDSHKQVEPIAGYGYEETWHMTDNAALGVGYTVFLTARSDIINYIPFPGILPLVAFTYQRAMLTFMYVPGRENIGNVLFVLASWTLD